MNGQSRASPVMLNASTANTNRSDHDYGAGDHQDDDEVVEVEEKEEDVPMTWEEMLNENNFHEICECGRGDVQCH